MIQNETHRSNLKMHQCKIEKIYESGLIDARSERDGSFFERINIVTSGTEGNLELRDKCVVISDGATHYVMGTFRETTIDDSGKSTVRNLGNDLSDLRDSKSISVNDDFGNQARVIVSKGGGVVTDGGEVCVTHHQPGNSKISHYAERYEVISPAATVQYNHDGINAEINYKFRTMVDPLSVARDYSYTREDELDVLGGVVTVDISGGTDLVEFKARTAGVVLATVTIGADGSIELQSGPDATASQVNMTPTGTVEMVGPLGNTVQVQSSGQVYVGGPNGTTDLKTQLDTLLQTITDSATVTISGPMPFIPANIVAATIKNVTLPLVLTDTKE